MLRGRERVYLGEYGISVPHVRIPPTITPVPYREHIRERVQLSPRAAAAAQLSIGDLFYLKLARGPLHIFPR